MNVIISTSLKEGGNYIRGKAVSRYSWKGTKASQRGSSPMGPILSKDSVLRNNVNGMRSC